MAANPVIAATDGSPASISAVEWAAREAVVRGAPLRIVSVLAGMSADGATAAGAAVTAHEGSGQALAAATRRAALVSPQLAPDTCLLRGQPVDALVQAASIT